MRKLLITKTALAAWRQLVLEEQRACRILLPEDPEHYLVSLLLRYSDKPALADAIVGQLYLNSQHKLPSEKQTALREVGDHCLLFAGLFPEQAERRRVSPEYFSELGKTAYDELAAHDAILLNSLYHDLVVNFDSMMAILQSIRATSNRNAMVSPELQALLDNLSSIKLKR